jgi:outer membrane protein insertion porin family
MGLILVLLLLSAEGIAEAQKRPSAPPRPSAPAQTAWPIESIAIEGLEDYTRAQVLAVLNLKVGQMASARDFEAARGRLTATGAFASAGFQYGPAAAGKGYKVTFQVTEAGPKFPILLEDLGLPPEELRAALARSDPFFGPTVPATEPLLARYAKTIEEYLAARNRPAKVIAKLEPDDSGQLAVVLRSAVSRPAIARLRFTGNSVIATPVLENAINQVAVGLPYTEARLRQVLDLQIRPLYEARGRVRVSFPEIRTEPEKDVKGLLVFIKVDEGASYSLGAADVQGTGLPPTELKKIASLKSGDVFNREAVEAVVAKIEQRMRRDGYLQVKSSVDRRVNDQAKKVDLTIRVQPGPRYTFAALKIEGLDIIAEPEIRKMWGVKAGQPFNIEYPQHFLDVVKEDGVLDNLGDTRAVVKTDDEQRTVDVTLIFQGAPPPKPTPKPPAGPF